MTEENDNLLDLVLDDSDNVSMIATQNLGFEGKADDDVNARKEFSKIVNHDFQFYKKKIRDINLNGKWDQNPMANYRARSLETKSRSIHCRNECLF